MLLVFSNKCHQYVCKGRHLNVLASLHIELGYVAKALSLFLMLQPKWNQNEAKDTGNGIKYMCL